MSDEMKENIIKYLTNNIENENPDPDLIYSEVETITNDLSSQLDNEFGSGTWSITDIIQGKTSTGNENELSLLYGVYEENNVGKGFFVVVDNLFNPIQIISQYSSGVDIGYINCINVDENGQFYMLENRLTDGKLRFIMLNNILVKLPSSDDYTVVIRRAYDVPNSSPAYLSKYQLNFAKKIIKAVGQAKYLIAGTLDYDEYGYGVFTTEIIINVGSSNEWNSLLGDSDWEYIDGVDVYCSWTDDNYNPIVLGYMGYWSGAIMKFTKSNDETALDYSLIRIDFSGYVSTWGQNAIILNDSEAYMAISGRKSGYTTFDRAIFRLELIGSGASMLYWFEVGDYNADYLGMIPIKLYEKEGEAFFTDIGQEIDENGIHFLFSICRIRDDNYYQAEISQKEIITITKQLGTFFNIINLNINKQFNLFNFNFLIDSNCYNVYQVYNKNNYNGIAFEGIKSLLPNEGILYDSNDKIVFARNLYNKVLSGKTTTSTIEVPYNYINDITISKKDLLSFNNNILVSDTQDFVKNEYETLDINFINTIDMENQNDPNNPIENTLGATRLNNSISNDLDYSNCTISKVKLHYNDNTTYIKEINKATMISQFVYRIDFNVYVPNGKKVNSIDIISGDTNTTYVSIDTTSLESGKTYKISQNVEIQ